MRLALALLLAEIVVPAAPRPHAEAIRALAEARAVVLVATKRCEGFVAGEAVAALPAALGLDDAEVADAYSSLVRRAAELNDAANKAGVKAWCNETFSRFGPAGTVRKGLLQRCDPQSSGC